MHPHPPAANTGILAFSLSLSLTLSFLCVADRALSIKLAEEGGREWKVSHFWQRCKSGVLFSCFWSSVSGRQTGKVDEMRAPNCRTISQNIRAYRCGLRIPGDIRERKNRKSEQSAPLTVNPRNILIETINTTSVYSALEVLRRASTPCLDAEMNSEH